MIALACAAGSACSHRRRDTGRDTPYHLWIFAAHQMGGALAGIGAGAVRSFSGDYLLAFMTSGLACLLASLLVLRIRGLAPAILPAV
ncbi:MAG TPA: hypothetical protein VNZ53_29000 [Steroidobacteraceae bacterium]|nr:hypothetical protein [Steroidobacteraceae bacterium]